MSEQEPKKSFGAKIKEGTKVCGEKIKAAFTLPNMKKGAKYAWKNGSAYIIFVVLVIIFEIFNTRFLSGTNIANIISDSTFIVIGGMGIMFVMLTGGIDLSVGWLVAVVDVTAAILMANYGVSPWLIWPLCILIGGACGFLNGFLASKLHLFPLIITLATGQVFQGIASEIAQGKTILGSGDAFEAFRGIYTIQFLGIRLDIYLAIFIVIVTWLVLNKTKFGRDVLAIGGSQETARLSGIKVALITTLAYTICGAIFAVAGLDMLAQQNNAQAVDGGIEFTCLTAAIIGGISMMGGKGNVMGMVVGIAIMQIISNGMQLASFDTYTQYIVSGSILLVAVAFDSFKNMPKPKLALVNRKKEEKK
jgi:ribose transport system permease protein